MSSAFSESQPCPRALSHLAKQFSSSGYSTSLVVPSWIGHRLGFIAQGSLVRILLLLRSKSSLLCSIPIVILYLYIYSYENLVVMKLRALSLVSATPKIEYSMQHTYSYRSLIHIPMLKLIGDENSEHCLWFLLCSKSSILCSITIVILYSYIYPY